MMNRPRFQFRLRTLMIVVALLAALCWGAARAFQYVAEQRQIFEERSPALMNREMVAWSQSWDDAANNGHLQRGVQTKPVPAMRQWLGDRAVYWIEYPRHAANPGKLEEELRRLFPEADRIDVQMM